MRIVAVLVLLVGVGLAGGALMFASKYFDAYEASLAAQNRAPDTVQVIVARAPINYGDRLGPENLKWVTWPAEAVPPGSFTTREGLLGESGDERRIALRQIEENEPILETKITGFGESPRMAMKLANGSRAVTIKIDAVTGVGGFIAAGDHVDVMLTRQVEDQLATSVILQDVPVIAVDQSDDAEALSPRVGKTVTVEVDSTGAQKLALAQQLGTLSLLLRGMADVGEEEEVKPVTTQDLVDLERDVVVDNSKKVRVRKGVAVETVDLENTTTPEDAAQ